MYNPVWFHFRMCNGIGWDKDGDTLAIINDKSGVVFLWDANTLKLTQLDSGLRYVSLAHIK